MNDRNDVEALVVKIESLEVEPFPNGISTPNNWYEWLQCWLDAKTDQTMLGLLHMGFTVPMNKRAHFEPEFHDCDRIKLYLTIADGYWMKDFRDDNPARSRIALARKAFDVLCAEFFDIEKFCKRNYYRTDNRGKPSQGEFWAECITSKKMFPMFRKFFDIDTEARLGGRIHNLEPRWHSDHHHGEKKIINCLLHLTKYIFDWSEARVMSYDWESGEYGVSTRDYRAEMNDYMRTVVDNAMPWLIEVLHDLDQLNFLLPWLLELNNECLVKLNEIAMRTKFESNHRHGLYLEKSREVKNLVEAYYFGSKAAQFLDLHNKAKQVVECANAIREAERNAEEASRKLAELTSAS
jgi:hypothetical protein